jgi:cellulose synthase/poly-beta-1,6-N-acetylglucosamine synthase-like glycosyltransferase
MRPVPVPPEPVEVMVATAAALALLVPATAACLAYLIPTLAGLVPKRRRAPGVPSHAFAVLIPARDEEFALPAALRSLAVLDYPPELVRVYVVADNCSDRTAAVAREAGAVCLVRSDPGRPGKGYAVAFGLERVLKDRPDAVLILDADCQLNPQALRELDAALAAGADAVQCSVRSRNADGGAAGYVAAVGAAVDDAVAAGRDRLGMAVFLRGTGMAFRRGVLERVPWAAFGPAEDAEYARQLRAAGVRVRHCGGAVVSCDAPAKVEDLCRQRRRWRAAGVLASKPLVLAHLALTLAGSVVCGFVAWPVVLVVLTAAVYLRAVFAVGISRRRLGSLLKSPAVVLRLGWVTLAGLLRREPATWDRTPRSTGTERRAA